MPKLQRIMVDGGFTCPNRDGTVGSGGCSYCREAFTVIAANTIGYSDKRLIFWNINGFWDELVVLFDSLRKKGVMTKEYSEVFTLVNSLEEIKNIIG